MKKLSKEEFSKQLEVGSHLANETLNSLSYLIDKKDDNDYRYECVMTSIAMKSIQILQVLECDETLKILIDRINKNK